MRQTGQSLLMCSSMPWFWGKVLRTIDRCLGDDKIAFYFEMKNHYRIWKLVWLIGRKKRQRYFFIYSCIKLLLTIEGCVSGENVASEDKCHLDFVPLPNNTWASGAGEKPKNCKVFSHPSFQAGTYIFATDVCFRCLEMNLAPFAKGVWKHICKPEINIVSL